MEEIDEDSSLDKVLFIPVFYIHLIKALFIWAIFFTSTSSIISRDENIQTTPNLNNVNNLKHDFEKLVKRYKYLIKSEENIDENSPIWMMWYQGIENAPPIVLSCIQSVIENRENHPVYIITKENIGRYIKLPYYIIKKFKDGVCHMTHFSEIIRMAILYEYGGYWIDPNYLVTAPIPKINTSFYTLKLDYCWTNDHPFITCTWSSDFMGFSKNSFIATYGYMALLLYWEKYNSVIDFFLIDYIIYIAYKKLPKFKKIINNLPIINCDIFSLVQLLNYKHKKKYLECPFHKLAIEGNWETSKLKKKTNYGYIIDKYKFDFKNPNKKIIFK